MRNALAHAGKSGRRVVSAFIATAFAQDDAEAARTQWRKVADQLRPKLPKLASFLDEAETDVLAYMTFPVNKDVAFDVLATVHHARYLCRTYAPVRPLIVGMPTWNKLTTPETDKRPERILHVEECF